MFQQTSTLWRKDKFLTSRAGNNKEGRKLDLDKRNKDLKTIVWVFDFNTQSISLP
jgi:hypothetical protein